MDVIDPDDKSERTQRNHEPRAGEKPGKIAHSIKSGSGCAPHLARAIRSREVRTASHAGGAGSTNQTHDPPNTLWWRRPKQPPPLLTLDIATFLSIAPMSPTPDQRVLGFGNDLRFARICVLAVLILSGSAARGEEAISGITEAQLAPISRATGKTMFTELPASETGVVIENNYADPAMWGSLYHEFEIGEIATGVAIGDYDSDGRPDIFIVSKTESCRLFRNLGGFKFQDVTDRAGVGDRGDDARVWKQGAAFADVNNDGRLDLYLARFNAPNRLYLNQGDGTFKEAAHAAGLDVTDASIMGAFCDYDRDGWLDVFVQTNLLDANGHLAGQPDYLFHNNRDGTFTNVTRAAGISGEAQGHSATWWDFDEDGWPDLYVANDFAPPDKLYRNNRNGTFTNVAGQVAPHVPFSAMGADLGDVNNDGRIDLMIAEMAATTHEKDQRGMVNTRSQAKELPADSREPQQRYFNTLLLNTGTGHCLESAFLAGVAATDWTWSLRFEDLDNDGRLDLHVTNGMHREATNADLLRRQMSAETPSARLRIMRDSPVMAEANLAFRNLGDLTFQSVGADWGLDQVGVSFGAAFGDLDGDGDLDLVYGNYQRGATVLRNDSDSGHRVIVELRGTRSNRFGAGATVRVQSATVSQVRQLVLARGLLSTSEPVVHFGLGGDPTITRLEVIWPSGRVQSFADLPADRRYIIMEPTSDTAGSSSGAETRPLPQFEEVGKMLGLTFSSREESIDETAQQRLLPMRLNRRGPAIAIDDRGDGQSRRIAFGGTSVSRAQIFQQSPGKEFVEMDTAALLPVQAIDDGPMLWFDANGDGRNDLLITKGGNSLPDGEPEYQPQLLFDSGNGRLSRAPEGTLPPLTFSVGAVAAADVDGDGRLDLFVGGRVSSGFYPFAPKSALLLNRATGFVDATEKFAPGLREVGMVTSALWSDADTDGRPDLLLTLEWGSVRYFHNAAGGRLEDWSGRAGFSQAGTGWWFAIATADFNRDGRPDYVAGNLGMNTQYHADRTHPAVLFVGDFGTAGETPQLVEAHYEGDRLVPWRSRLDLAAAIPDIRKRFPENDAFARATLEEILGADRLAAAARFEATEFRSGVFLSQSDGFFRFQPLPRIAQIAPLQGMVASDFNGDGYDDIYAVQNLFAPVPAIGHFDGGLSQMLRGDGMGGFTPVPPSESGLVVRGDAKALVLFDINDDGWPDFLVSRNNDTCLVFRNRGIPGHNSLKILLDGLPAEESPLGSRVTVTFADGSSQIREVGCKSGYYSQSTIACIFGWLDSNPPKVAHVRWPSGITTQHPISAATHTVVVTPGDGENKSINVGR